MGSGGAEMRFYLTQILSFLNFEDECQILNQAEHLLLYFARPGAAADN